MTLTAGTEDATGTTGASMYSSVSSRSRPLRMEDYLRLFSRCVPELTRPELYKGATARIAVVGGSAEYTGAPYFAAMSSLRAGGELAHVFCAAAAATPIKSYSPELIVHPDFAGLAEALPNMHAVILGPGLGRSENAREIVRSVLSAAVDEKTSWPLVIDADALWFLAEDHQLREILRAPLVSENAPRVYITPNIAELGRLCSAMQVTHAMELVDWFRAEAPHSGRVICVAKGRHDVVTGASAPSDGLVEVIVDVAGGKKRCGGQGDVLAGLVALCVGWTSAYMRSSGADSLCAGSTLQIDSEIAAISPAVAACVATRIASGRAFQDNGRAMVASDMLSYVANALELACARLSADHA